MSVTPILSNIKPPPAISATIDQIEAAVASVKDHSTASFLSVVERLQKIFMLALPFVSFHSTVRDDLHRVSLAWDGLRIVVKKTAALPVPTQEEQWQAITGLAEDAILVLKKTVGL